MRRQPTSNPTRADSTRTASSSRHHRPPLTIGAADSEHKARIIRAAERAGIPQHLIETIQQEL